MTTCKLKSLIRTIFYQEMSDSDYHKLDYRYILSSDIQRWLSTMWKYLRLSITYDYYLEMSELHYRTLKYKYVLSQGVQVWVPVIWKCLNWTIYYSRIQSSSYTHLGILNFDYLQIEESYLDYPLFWNVRNNLLYFKIQIFSLERLPTLTICNLDVSKLIYRLLTNTVISLY